ncbi:MAG: hypothetical protein MI867_15470 [Pseudomonadales bacterium]|nr:hypothetical protein [Pseudomonadales bacterium]
MAISIKQPKSLLLILFSIMLLGCDQPLVNTPLENPIFNQETVELLNNAELMNGDAIIEEILLTEDETSPEAFSLANPYEPITTLTEEECSTSESCTYAKDVLNRRTSTFPARGSVYDWWVSRETLPETAEVCGIKFLDDDFSSYRLDTFENIEALEATDGYSVTHYLACGACSTLQDLAVYGTLDLTIMAKTCSKRSSIGAKKSCMQEIGFSESCAEVWAYNGQKTAQTCAIECIKEYGLINLLLGNEDSPPVNEDGELNRCLMCDELMSGPGFQYGSGRTRRNSGITSEIERPDEQVYDVTHSYF